MKKILIVGLLFVLGSQLYAQQESQYTQYMYNTMTINPGYTGSRGFLSLVGLYRAQWVGIDGAPKTASFAGSMPINERGDGLGLVFDTESLGAQSQTGFSINYAYSLPISESVKLGLGINAGGTMMTVDHGKLNAEDGTALPEERLSKFFPNFGAGAYMYSEDWYVGLSVPSILETNFYKDAGIEEPRTLASERMHFYVVGGYVFELSDNLKFKPASLLKVVTGAPIALDLSANFLFNEKFTVGAGYRLGTALSLLAGFQITEGLMIGYGFDYDTNSDFAKYNNGSHELLLRFELATSKSRVTKIMTPRFF